MSEPVPNTPSGETPKAPPSATPSSAAALPKARIERSRTNWLYWLFPLAAIGVCCWFFYRDVLSRGPTITIYFQNAEGLEENNTQIQFRGARVGQVKALSLSKDHQFVKVTAQLTGAAADLARAGSRFWIVRPELKLGSVSGLRTIISGEYIAVHPGGGPRTNEFIGAEREPVAEQPAALRIVLLASDLSTLQEQSPISYRGIEVGEVMEYRLGTNAQEVVIQALIRAEYAPLVRRNSVFWNAGRFSMSWGLFRGAQIGAESPAALLTGAIDFATPTELQEPATNGMVFRLNDKAKDDWKGWSPAIKLPLSGAVTGTNAAVLTR